MILSSSSSKQDGKEALAPKYYIEPLTRGLTYVAKKVPCLSKFFARYKDIFGQWFAVTPHIATTEPPGKLDLETLHKKVRFDPSTDINLSKGGVYDPDAVDDLISWLEGNRRQDVIMHQIADKVGNLNPGQYITPRLMFPSHRWFMALFYIGQTLGCCLRIGRDFLFHFDLLIVGQLVWYVVKVLMNCSYIHSVHGCSAKIEWSFCIKVFFTRNYRHEQRQQGAMSERSDNDPSNQPKPTILDRIKSFGNFGWLNSLHQADSDEEIRNSIATDMRDIRGLSSTNMRRQGNA